MADLTKYWPLEDEVTAVCGFQAEFLEEHILLSVHRKLKFDYINRTDPTKREETDEDFLINDFIKENRNNFQLTIVEGFSGVGKSHYIKWLQAKINSDDKYHIVWFRRNINLKEIFNLILDPFKDDPLFSEILDEIDKEFSSIERQPGVRFQSGLQLVLREIEENLQNEILALRDQEINNLTSLPQLRKKLWHYKNLIMVMGEPSLTEEYFLKESFPRIIKRAAGGKDENLIENSSKFLAEDLKEAFEKANPDVINAKVYNYLNDLNSEDGFNEATNLLNEIVDEAIKNSFKFNLKQKTFPEIIENIRKKLFQRGKELVFLIEDFYWMTGIQKDLLPIFVEGGQNIESSEKLCMIRTALAVTDDFFSGGAYSSTVQRASRFLIKRENPNEDQIIEITADIVGSRLNAARWGSKKLKEHKDAASENEEWVKNYEEENGTDEELSILKDFDKSPTGGFSLFPYNMNVIKSYVNNNFKTGNTFRFISRDVIFYLINEPLNIAKSDFLNKNFPSESFIKKPNLSPQTENQIELFDISKNEKLRYKILVGYWGSNPRKLEDLIIKNSMFEVFSLKTISELGVTINDPTPVPDVVPEPSPGPTIIPEPTQGQSEPIYSLSKKAQTMMDEVKKWEDNQTRFSYRTATDIRNFINLVVKQRLAWEKIGIREQKIDNQWFALPNQSGNDRSRFTLNNDNTEDYKINLFYESIIRLVDKYNSSNEFKSIYHTCETEAEINDLIVVLNHIDYVVVPQIENYFLDEKNKKLKELSNILFYQSLVIGNDAELKKDNIIKNITHKFEENINPLNLESLLEQNSNVNIIFKWDMLKKDTFKKQHKVVEELQKWASTVQGGNNSSNETNAIMFYDAFSILSSLDGKIENMKLDDEVAYIRNLKDIETITSKFLDAFKHFNSQVNEFLKTDDSLNEFYSLINELFENLVRSNINLEGHTRGQLNNHLNQLKKYNEEIGIKKLQNECNEILKETDTLKKYRRLGKLKFIEVIDLSNSLIWINSFLNLVESKLSPSGVSLVDDQNDLEDKMIDVFEKHKNQFREIT